MHSQMESADSADDPPPLVERLNEVAAAKRPEFQFPNGQFDYRRYQVYLEMKDREEAAVRPPRDGPAEYEILMTRLVAKVCDIGEELYASNRTVWPPNADGSIPGHRWGQPYWLRLLVDAYLSGKSGAQDGG